MNAPSSFKSNPSNKKERLILLDFSKKNRQN